MTTKTNAIFVIDASGSMLPLRETVVAGFNRELSSIREKAPDTKVTVVSFNGLVSYIAKELSIHEVQNMSYETYFPSGGTALFDAVGDAIDRVLFELGHKSKQQYLCSILSDGEENASLKYNAAQIKDRIVKLSDRDNWTFTYTGANQNLVEICDKLGIVKSNAFAYTATQMGTQSVFQARGGASANWALSATLGHNIAANYANTKTDEVLVVPENTTNTVVATS